MGRKMVLGKLVALASQKVEEIRWDHVYEGYRRKYEIAKTFRFNGPSISLIGDNRICFGENSYIGSYSTIQSAAEGCEVVVGRDCVLSHYIMIYTKNHSTNPELRGKGTPDCGSIHVGNDCWIGARVFIRQGVTIGDRVAVGANSVVTRDVPDGSVVAGCPAEIKKGFSVQIPEIGLITRNFSRKISSSIDEV
jgi:maltose O-acetyltransferase